jgi:cell division protein FtsB
METRDEQIERILKLTEETHQMVKAMKRRHTMSSLVRIIYLGLFIYASWWAYKELMPYMDQLRTLTQQVTEMSKSADQAKDKLTPELQKLLDKLPK